jgi:proline iminopeptidase
MTIEFHEGFVRVLGHRLFWKSIGGGERGTILCLHGGPGGNHWFTMPMADMASLGYRVVMYDQFGCGRSDRPRSFEGYSIESAAREVDAVRRALRLGRCHLWGSSYGGALALQAVLQSPGSFRTLMVSSGFASVRQAEDELARLVRRLPRRDRAAIESGESRSRMNTPSYRTATEKFYRIHGSGFPVRPYEVVLGFQNQNLQLNTALNGPQGGLLTRSTGTIANWDVRDQLGRIRIPTLVMVGRRDFVPPPCARAIHRGIPGSQLVIFENAGHEPAFKERGAFMQVVRDFLAGRRTAGSQTIR